MLTAFVLAIVDRNICCIVRACSYIDRNVTDMINEMIACNDKSALQVLMVSGGMFDSFVSLLCKTTVRISAYVVLYCLESC
jgi:hypothetical protein